jgi:proton-dependent oligopeptide transporter, POT family
VGKQEEIDLSLAQRWNEIRDGFERPFWVANISEIFERLSYYAAFASLARYLHETLQFDSERAASLTGLFGFVWFLTIFGGPIADRIGFRRALSLAYFILSCSYFLLGSLGATWMAGIRQSVPLVVIVSVVIILPAFGVALVKPSVVGTTARASKPNVRAVGFSIYYTMVNIGSTGGPLLASYVHRHMRVENVFRVAAASVFLMFIGVLIFFKEPRREEAEGTPTLTVGEVIRNFGKVALNPRFMLFLVIFSGYWIVFWQQYIILPIYIHDYISATADTELILISDPLTVICFTMVFSLLTSKMRAFSAITLGTLISSVAWIAVVIHPSVPMAVVALVVLAIGEITQQPRYYEYISKLAPPGQQGTYMGFAFLPIGIGSIVAGRFGGAVLHHYGEVQHRPAMIWWSVTAVGVVTTILLFLYDRFLLPKELPSDGK